MEASSEVPVEFAFTLEIHPEPKKEVRKGANGSFYNPGLVYTNALKVMMKKYAPAIPSEKAILLSLRFNLLPPNSISNKKRLEMLEGKQFPVKRPDIDNLCYPLTNAIKNLFIKDDSQIVSCYFSKRYSSVESIEVIIKEM